MTTPFLIFLISQPRAGSTLLQRMLATHPEIHTTAEPWLMLPPIYALRDEGHTAEFNAAIAATALQDFLTTLKDGSHHHDEAIRRYAIYLYKTACEQAGKPIFLDKTPRYYHILPELSRIFPSARFIFLFRNPLAVLASFLNTHVRSHWIVLGRYQHDLLTAPYAMLKAKAALGERTTTVHYEKLVTNPETELQRICKACHIAYTPDLVNYGDISAPEGRMGDQASIQHHRRPSQKSLARWHELAKNSQTKHLAMSYLDELGNQTISAMGYDKNALQEQLKSLPSQSGKIEFTWRELMYPSPKLNKRMALVEFAILQHRWLVHRLKNWGKRK
jgi:hypothetical protein